MTFLDSTFYGNSVLAWIVALGVALIATAAMRLAIRLLGRTVGRLTRRTDTTVDDLVVDMLSRTKGFLVLAIGLYLGSLALTLPANVAWGISRIAVVAFVLQAALWGNEAINFVFTSYLQGRADEDPTSRASVAAVRILSRIAFWSAILLVMLDNLGFDVTAVIAGLGIGGVAIALALQNILGDLFASLSILMDEPFAIGDFINIGDFSGSVESVGLKTTRVRSLTGEQVVFANSDMLGSRIRNFGRLRERRITFTLGVTYDTPAEKLERIPEMIRAAIESRDNTRFDRSHFASFGDSALLFETVYYMTVPDYNHYMDTQQAINLELVRRFEAEGLEFAYPTQTVYVHGAGAARPATGEVAARSANAADAPAPP